MAVPKKVADRITSNLKRMTPIIQQQQARDVSEADTVTLVKDLLSEVFGYDKYSELTGELAIRGTYCDLAVKVDDKFVKIIEVKAIGLSLTERHLKQVVDYAANQGVEWVVLTNGVEWQLHHVMFGKPIGSRKILAVNMLEADLRDEDVVEDLFAFSVEGFRKGVPAAVRDRQDAINRFLIAALITKNESVLSVLRRELRRVVDVNVSEEEVVKVLEAEVIKREALEGPAAVEAAGRAKRAVRKALRSEPKRDEDDVAGRAGKGPTSATESAPS